MHETHTLTFKIEDTIHHFFLTRTKSHAWLWNAHSLTTRNREFNNHHPQKLDLGIMMHYYLRREPQNRSCKVSKINTYFSLSPSHLDIRSEDETEKNVELFASVATAFARYDFPVPGGPNKRIPRQGVRFPKNISADNPVFIVGFLP